MKIKKLHNAVYYFDLWFLTQCTAPEAIEFVNRKMKTNFCLRNSSFPGAQTFRFDVEHLYIISLHQTEDFGNLAHEALHVCTSVLTLRGLSLSVETDEAYCYLLEWIVREGRKLK